VFKVELDLSLYYDPPMEDHGGGIVVTRTLELPFPPTPDLAVWSMEMDECPEPMGFKLDDLVWDMGRQVFLAKTQISSSGLPMAMIPYEVRSWVDRGWRLGSWMDSYRQDEAAETSDRKVPSETPHWDDDDMERWMTCRPADRPENFNKVFDAMVRTMAELHNNWSAAYAMHRTKLFFDEADMKDNESAATKKWLSAKREFIEMPIDKQIAWQERVIRKYPSLSAIVSNLPVY
jgi:hypothetical protein